MAGYGIFSYTSNLEIANSLKKLKKQEIKLNSFLKKKLEHNSLYDYLDIVWEIKKNNIDFIDFAISSVKKQTNPIKEYELIHNMSELYNERLELEMMDANMNSLEVSINILHNTHSSMNAMLRELYSKDKHFFEGSDKVTRDTFEVITIPCDKEEITFEYYN